MTRKQGQDLTLLIATLLLLIIIVALSSCSDKATRYAKRSKKWEEKAIAAGAKVTADTVIKEVAISIPEVKTDTVFQSQPGDTVRIEKERLRIKYVNLPKDSVYIYGECKADTVIKRIPVAVYKKISAGHTTWDMVILGIATFFAGWLLMSFVIVPVVRLVKRKSLG